MHYLCIILMHFEIRHTSWELKWIVPFGLVLNKYPIVPSTIIYQLSQPPVISLYFFYSFCFKNAVFNIKKSPEPGASFLTNICYLHIIQQTKKPTIKWCFYNGVRCKGSRIWVSAFVSSNKNSRTQFGLTKTINFRWVRYIKVTRPLPQNCIPPFCIPF